MISNDVAYPLANHGGGGSCLQKKISEHLLGTAVDISKTVDMKTRQLTWAPLWFIVRLFSEKDTRHMKKKPSLHSGSSSIKVHLLTILKH